MSKKIIKPVEEGARVVRRKTNIQHVLLHTIAAAGVLSVAMLAPNALQVLRMFDKGKNRKMNPKYFFGTVFEKLLAKGMVTIDQSKNGKRVRLTEHGKHELARMVAQNPDQRAHKRWDRRWRMVIYDIKEERKVVRMRLQQLLHSFGFYKLQNSVWVYPYDCEALLILLKADVKIGNEVLYMVVEKIENDQRLKKHFELHR
jgi:CRISPR/Cas system-associated endoribonuclease Cas2